ncbi:hypothetical protein ECANGB1_2647 [Enterospora canceri]|uniref:Secreted protein n=1 Tax=Enterospora canceri TaxID=1081671 RepID=A0A1Y1S8Q7_9MICR|nr:hypothetical protein ECANGB1_2647 [Enterospora canceri]
MILLGSILFWSTTLFCHVVSHRSQQEFLRVDFYKNPFNYHESFTITISLEYTPSSVTYVFASPCHIFFSPYPLPFFLTELPLHTKPD